MVGKSPQTCKSPSKEKVGILQGSVSLGRFSCCEPNSLKQICERVRAYQNRTVKKSGRAGKTIGFEEGENVFLSSSVFWGERVCTECKEISWKGVLGAVHSERSPWHVTKLGSWGVFFLPPCVLAPQLS